MPGRIPLITGYRTAQNGTHGAQPLAQSDLQRQVRQRLEDLFLGPRKFQPKLGMPVEIMAKLGDIAMKLPDVFKNFRDGHARFTSNEQKFHNIVEGFIRVCDLRNLPSMTKIARVA